MAAPAQRPPSQRQAAAPPAARAQRAAAPAAAAPARAAAPRQAAPPAAAPARAAAPRPATPARTQPQQPPPIAAPIAHAAGHARSLVNAAAMDFGDTDVRGGFKDRPVKFKMESGRRYRLRIMTIPLAYYGANIQAADGSDRGFFALSLAPYNVAHAAVNGDAGAMAEAAKLCPLFERGYNLDRRWVVLIHLIGVESRGRVTKLNQVLPWAFGKDKYSKLTEIYNTLRTSDGRQIPLSRIELNVLCTEAGFQKVDITPITSTAQMSCTYEQSLAACAGEFNDPTNPNAGSPLLDEFIEPDPRPDLIRSLNRLEGTGQLPPDRDNFASPAYPPVGGELPNQGDDFPEAPGDGSVNDAFDAAGIPPAEGDGAFDAGGAAGGSPVDDLDALLQ